MKKKWLCYSVGLATAIILSGCNDKELNTCPSGTISQLKNGKEECVFSKNADSNIEVIQLTHKNQNHRFQKEKDLEGNIIVNTEIEKGSKGDSLSYKRQSLSNDEQDGVVLNKKDNLIASIKDVEKEKSEQEELIEKEDKKLTVTVQSGDSILKILGRHDIPTRFFYNLPKEQQEHLVDIKVGDSIDLELTPENELISLTKKISLLDTMVLNRSGDGYKIDIHSEEPILNTNVYKVVVNNSLYVDGKKAGLTDYTIAKMQKILGEKIDFVYEIRKGDTFTVMVERPTFEGTVAGTPKVLGIKLNSSRHGEVYAFRYKRNDTERVGYYDLEGESLKTGFLRIPTDYTRVSSNFNPHRLHPKYGYVRPHKGTDFAAPTGTPIYAASDGRVTRSGWGSGWGKMVEIDHGNGIKTRYAHMHRRSVKKNEYVKQGDVIGTVGMSGTATGPHLHYEFLKNNVQVDAMKVELPAADPLPKAEIASFNNAISNVVAALSSVDSEELYVYNNKENNQG